jgi:hypothetical protein
MRAHLEIELLLMKDDSLPRLTICRYQSLQTAETDPPVVFGAYER